MSSSTQIDVNYYSISNNIAGLYEGGSNPQPLTGKENISFNPPNPGQYAGILKIGDNSTVVLFNINVSQGYESAVDINNNCNTRLSGVFGDTNKNGNQIISVKGGSYAVFNGVLRGEGERKVLFFNLTADVLVDNWSDQNYKGSFVDMGDSTHEAKRKIKVVKRFFASTVLGANISLLYFQSFLFTVYWWAKFLVRKIMRIKKGEKGPSWL